jgi:hypothetical protein
LSDELNTTEAISPTVIAYPISQELNDTFLNGITKALVGSETVLTSKVLKATGENDGTKRLAISRELNTEVVPASWVFGLTRCASNATSELSVSGFEITDIRSISLVFSESNLVLSGHFVCSDYFSTAGFNSSDQHYQNATSFNNATDSISAFFKATDWFSISTSMNFSRVIQDRTDANLGSHHGDESAIMTESGYFVISSNSDWTETRNESEHFIQTILESTQFFIESSLITSDSMYYSDLIPENLSDDFIISDQFQLSDELDKTALRVSISWDGSHNVISRIFEKTKTDLIIPQGSVFVETQSEKKAEDGNVLTSVIVATLLFLVLLISFLIFFVFWRRRQQREPTEDLEWEENPPIPTESMFDNIDTHEYENTLSEEEKSSFDGFCITSTDEFETESGEAVAGSGDVAES